MEIKEKPDELEHDALKNAAEEFLVRFCTPAFGALPKTKIELVVMRFLERAGFITSEPEVYELVSKLKITRTKARNLIYERDLIRLSPEQLDDRVKFLLERPLIQKSGDLFILEVENREFNSEVRHSPVQPEPVFERPLQAA